MRRSAALLVLPLLTLAAGCSGSGGSASGATPAVGGSGGATGAAGAAAVPSVGSSAAVAADKALSGNTKAICAQAQRTSTSFGQKFIGDLQAKIDAASQGADAKARAQEQIDQDVASYSSALSGMASLADDKPLKAALTQMSKQVKALKGDITKLNPEKMSAISANLDKACGKS